MYGLDERQQALKKSLNSEILSQNPNSENSCVAGEVRENTVVGVENSRATAAEKTGNLLLDLLQKRDALKRQEQNLRQNSQFEAKPATFDQIQDRKTAKTVQSDASRNIDRAKSARALSSDLDSDDDDECQNATIPAQHTSGDKSCSDDQQDSAEPRRSAEKPVNVDTCTPKPAESIVAAVDRILTQWISRKTNKFLSGANTVEDDWRGKYEALNERLKLQQRRGKSETSDLIGLFQSFRSTHIHSLVGQAL